MESLSGLTESLKAGAVRANRYRFGAPLQSLDAGSLGRNDGQAMSII